MRTTRSAAAGLAVGAAMMAGSAVAQAPDRDTIVVAQSIDIESFEPAGLNNTASVNVANHIWGTLLDVTPDGEIVPYLAESYSWNQAGNAITFKLKSGLKCEDGEALTAEDVAFSFNRVADPELKLVGSSAVFVFPSIGFVRARADDALTVTVEMRRYQSIAPGMLARVYVHCKDSYEKMTKEQAALRPVASGPYKLDRWVKDDRVVLVRNDQFTARPVPFQRAVFRVVPDSSTRAAELIAGGVDIATNIVPDQKRAIEARGTATVASVQGTRRIFVGFNFTDAFKTGRAGEAIHDVRVRRALNMAVDVPTICRQLLASECERAAGPANRGNPDVKAYPYDPKQAEAMLDAAGFRRGPDGVRFALTLQGGRGRYLNDVDVMQAVAQYLTDVGVRTTVDVMDFVSTFSPMARTHRAGPLYLIGQGGATWSSVFDMALFPSKTAPVNNGQWFNEGWQSRWDRLGDIRDPAQEQQVVNEMLKLFAEDAPWIFLYFQPDFYGVSNRVAWAPRRDERIDVLDAKVK